MNDKIILFPFAYIENASTGANISKNNTNNIYLKNAIVSLVSAKNHNINCDIAFVTNIEVPEFFKSICEKEDILIINVPYDEFRFPNDYKWSLAFYKLCVLKYFVNNSNYSYISYLDIDVYVQDSFDNIWEECNTNIMLYDICHGRQTKDYRDITEEFASFTNNELKNITHYGGEFFAANKDNAKQFIKECNLIYKEMINKNFLTSKGDEFIVSLAAYNNREIVKNAGAYIYRYWTELFRLVSTNYKYNVIAILHVPSEKENGMIKLYNFYLKNKKLPKINKVHSILHLKHRQFKTYIHLLLKKIDFR